MSTHDDAVRAVLAQAAVCEHFDAQALVAAITDASQQRTALQQLARDAIEIEHDGAFRWTLQQPARQRVLAELSEAEFERALAAQSQDALARQIAAIVGKTKAAMANGPVRYRALELLRLAQSQGAAIARQDLGQQARSSRADLNRQSATASLQSTLRSPLRGRAGELRLLREFAGAGARAIEAQYAPLTGAVLHRANLAQRRWPDVPALLLSGSGGVGKSALVAELIRKERGPLWDGRVVVHFDFDEPALRAGDQGAMLLDVARQIALARPALDEALSASRANLRRSLLEIERSPSGAYERLKFAITVELSSWKPLLAEHKIHDLVLVLDTLEEVTVVDFARLDSLFGWLDTLRVDSGLQRVQVIGSGRALVPDGSRARLWPYFLAELALGDLGARAARAMLRDRLVREKLVLHVEQVWRCVEVFGGNPLVLSILARYCVDNDVAALIALLDQARSDDGLARFGDAAQRFLYGRILERVRDEDIKPLANPGLVLRRVTPTLIREVLADPCGLGAIDTARAQALLEKLQRLAWLVTPDGDGLRHRRDVRRQMLGLILDREGARAVAVNQAAARWYAAQADASGARDAALLESWYHRGLLGEIASGDEADLRALGDHLGEDVEDLPSNVRALVKYAAGRTLTQAEHAALPTPQQERVSVRQARTLRQEGLESAALGKVRVKAKPVTVADPMQSPDQLDGGALPGGDDVLESLPSDNPVMSPAGRVVPQHPAAADPELVKAWFGAGEFEEVAKQLPALLVEYWDRVRRGESAETALADEPAYLAAIAARAFSSEPVNWVDLILEPVLGYGADSAAAIYMQKPAIRVIEILLRHTSGQKTLNSAPAAPGIDAVGTSALSPSLKSVPNDSKNVSAGAIAQRIDGIDDVPLSLLNDWKIVLAGAMEQQIVGMYDVPLSLAALPFLRPELVDLLQTMGLHSEHHAGQLALPQDADEIVASWKQGLPNTGGAVGWHDVLRPIYTNNDIAYDVALSRDVLDLLADSGLSGVSRLAGAVAGIGVTFDLTSARGGGSRLIGLVPELYAPIRSAFEAELSPLETATLVEQATASLQRWPAELVPASFATASADRRNELLPVLLTIADYHGCLGDLVRAAGANATPDSRIGRVAKLFVAFEAAWAL